MTSAGKLTTKAIAVIIIVAMLDAVGVPPMIMVLFTGMCFVVWLFARRAQAREVERIFDFYIAADAVLREEERRWYGFEIAEVIEHGESLLDIMPDPPPLNYYALGALYQRLGNHAAAVEYLSRRDGRRALRRNSSHCAVTTTAPLRFDAATNRVPAIACATDACCNPKSGTCAATQCDADCCSRVAHSLEAQQQAVKEEKPVSEADGKRERAMFAPSMPLSEISAPPPITKVLHDVYQDETRTSN